jgi:hypothetical protein
MPNKKDWALMTLSLAGGRPLTPVQLQKSLFLLGENVRPALPEDFYVFAPYNYGPFCQDIYQDVELLASEGLVTITRDPQYGYALYAATPQGVTQGQTQWQKLEERYQQYAKSVVDWVLPLSFSQLVSAIYKKYPNYQEKSIFRSKAE